MALELSKHLERQLITGLNVGLIKFEKEAAETIGKTQEPQKKEPEAELPPFLFIY